MLSFIRFVTSFLSSCCQIHAFSTLFYFFCVFCIDDIFYEVIVRQILPSFRFIKELYHSSPDAAARISGNADYPSLSGTVSFYQSAYVGLLIQAEVWGLPVAGPDSMGSFFFAMHIHEYGDCTPPFDKTGMHFNPGNLPHPQHAGDLIPLLGNHGYAWCVFYDERLSLAEIIGKSVIIHRNADDFHTQPSGNSGEKIGCGAIQWFD